MKYITAFFMAWGNFITLPCPLKKWDSNLKNMMLALLPSVGLVIGILWAALYWVVDKINLPAPIACIVLIYYIFAICGFMHLDGFMDCNDAILSRRPLEERQRILKDSTVGAFAAVTLVFLLLAWYATVSSAYGNILPIQLIYLPVISRGFAGACVLTYKPIGHSQYVKDFEQPDKKKHIAVITIQVSVITAIICTFLSQSGRMALIAMLLVMFIVNYIACLYARKQLGGMSGDVAGYIICLSELSGIITLALAGLYTL